MTNVKLLADGLLIASTIHPLGDVVALPDKRALELIREGFAEEVAGPVDRLANPDHNPLGDAIHPAPPDEAHDDQAGAQESDPGRPKLRARQGRGRVAETASVDNPGTEG